MDFQSFVNETFHKLARQGEQSVQESGWGISCAFFGPKGLHCAIGFWLDQSKLDARFNLRGVRNPEVRAAMPAWMLEFDQPAMLDLQHVHDMQEHWRSPQVLIDAMKTYAVAHGVIFDPTIEAEVWANWKGNPPLVDPVMPALPVPEPAKMSYFSSSTPYGSPVLMGLKLYDTTA